MIKNTLKNKGKSLKLTTLAFTLIELLAVIVILAIIALIATPIILGIIKDAKEESNKRSLEMYADALENAIVAYQLENDKAPTSFSDIESYIEYDGAEINCMTSIVYSDGTYYLGDCKVNNESVQYTYGKGPVCKRAKKLNEELCDDGSLVYGCVADGLRNKLITYGNINITEGKLTSGDAFDCDVDGNGTYDTDERFYYISGLNGDENSEYAVLIYYSNTTNGISDNKSSVAYYYPISDNHSGPLTAVNNLPTTKQWSNVKLSNTLRQITNELNSITNEYMNKLYNISQFNYKTSTGIEYAARFLTSQELEYACKIKIGSYKSGELTKCKYLLENTNYTDSSNSMGYWLETPHSESSYMVWQVGGIWRQVNKESTNYTTNYGARPVIEVLKQDMLY